MKKNYILIAIVGVLAAVGIFIAINTNYNNAYAIEQAGYTYSPKGEIVSFSKEATYNNAWINNEKTITDDSKNKAIDLSRTLFLKDGTIKFLGKSVAIKDATELKELPSYATVAESGETYKVSDSGNNAVDQLPKGTIVKLAEGRYLILDDATLHNKTGLNQKLAENTIVVIDENKKIRLNADQKTEEMSSDDLFIELDNNTKYYFDLAQEMLVSKDESLASIDVRAIKVEIDDEAEARKLKEKEANAASDKKDSSSEAQADSASKSSLPGTGGAESSSEASANLNQNGNGNSDATGNGTDSETNSGTSGGAGGDSESSGSGNATQDEVDEINDLIDKLNELEGKSSFQVPVLDVNVSVKGKVATGEITVYDSSDRLTALEANLLDESGNVIEKVTLDPKKDKLNFEFRQLAYGKKYQIVVKGSYLSADDKPQETTFYRKTFTATPAVIDKTIIERGPDYLVVKLTATELYGNIDQFSLKYKVNSSAVPTTATVNVNAAALTANKEVTVRLENLTNNQDYMIEMNQLIVDGENVTDPSWYLVGTTTKLMPTIDGLTASYVNSSGNFSVAPNNLVDADSTITSIRYVAYRKDEFDVQGTEAQEYASATVEGGNKFAVALVGRTVNMTDGGYVFVAYITGNNGQSDFTITSPVSNEVVVGRKELPTIQFSLNEAEQDALTVDYELFDLDGTILFNALTHPVMEIYQTDINGNIGAFGGVPVATIDFENQSDISNQFMVDGLISDSYYVAVFRASYDLQDGAGIQVDQEIGRSGVYKTTAVLSVVADITLTQAATDEADIKVKLSEAGGKIKEANLNVYDQNNNLLISIPIGGDIDSLVSASGSDYHLTGLASNQSYKVLIESAKDSGLNNIPVTGNLTFKTRREAPVTDKVLTDYRESSSELGAVAGIDATKEVMSDPQNGVNSIVYRIYRADDLATPLMEKVIDANFGDYVYFDLSAPELGRGHTYVVKADVVWHDNYDSHTISIESDSVAVSKAIPKIEYQIIERTNTQLKLKVFVEDTENTLVAGSLKLNANGTVQTLALQDQEITIPVTDAGLLLETSGDYVLTVGSPPEHATFITKTLAPINASVPVLTQNIQMDATERILQLTTTPDAVGLQNILYASYELYKDSEATPTYQSEKIGSDLFTTHALVLPTNDIWFDHTYQLDLTTRFAYAENTMNYSNIGSQFYLSLDNHTAFVKSTAGKLGKTTSQTGATSYVLSQGNLDSKGNITGVVLENTYTGGKMAYKSNTLVDNETTATEFTFERQADGSYVAMLNGRYVNFASGLVLKPSDASKIDLYSVSLANSQASANLTTKTLTAPTVNASNLQIFDTRVLADISGLDTDKTIVRTNGKQELYVHIYEIGGVAPIKSVRVDALPTEEVTLADLAPGTDYRMTVEGSYDLGDGNGAISKIFYDENFTTEKSLPVMDSTRYTWSPVYGNRKITGTVSYTDVSNVLTDVEYRIYEKTADLAYLPGDLDAMATALSGKTPVSTFNSTATNPNFPLQNPITGAYNYVSGKTYIIAAYMHTSLSQMPVFLSNVYQISITPPTTPTSELKVEGITTKSATVQFKLNDPQGYILAGETKNFNYQIVKSDDGEVVKTGTFTGGSNFAWYDTFTDLKPGTGYTFTLSSIYDDLNGGGSRPWSRSVSFVTDDEYVSTNALTIDLNQGAKQVELKVQNVMANSATINKITLQLYERLDYGGSNDRLVIIDSKVMPNPSSYPAVISNVFNVPGMTTGQRFVGKLVIEYTTPLNETRTYTIESDGVVVRNASRATNFSAFDVSGTTVSAQLDTTDLPEDDYTFTLLDENENVLDEKSVPLAQMEEAVDLAAAPAALYIVEVTNSEDEVVGVYQTSTNETTVNAYAKQDNSFMLQKADATATDQYVVTIQPKVWSQYYLIFEQTYEVSGNQLKEGYSIPQNLSDFNVTVQNKTTNESYQVLEWGIDE